MDHICISIIIPHYNTPELLVRCLKSIPVRQDYQVIVVDDCSPNYHTYKNRYPELKRPYLEMYSTPKGGSAGRARNIGLDHSKGKWLLFVDADDLLPEGIEQTLDELKDRSEEVVFMDYMSVFSDDLTKESDRNPTFHKLLLTYAQDHDEAPLRYRFDPMWCKLVRRELIQRHHLRFDETRWNNDSYMSLCVGIHAKSIYVKPIIGYILTESGNSLTSNFCGTRKEMESRLGVTLRMTRKLKKHGISLKYSHLPFFLSLARSRYSFAQRCLMAFRFWRDPIFILRLLRP